MESATGCTYLDQLPQHCDEWVAIGWPGALPWRSQSREEREHPAGRQTCSLFVEVPMTWLSEQVP